MSIVENLGAVLGRIRVVLKESVKCDGAGEPQLIVVSKVRTAEEIREVLATGHVLFGENRVQEAASKWPGLREDYPDIELHLIGPLQSNKVAEAVGLFDVIETVDRPKIAGLIAREMKAQGKVVKLFVQVNIGNEPQKAGIAPDELAEFLTQCREEYGLSISGLMCIPPVGVDPVPYFEKMKALAKANEIEELSMGMSSDYEVALKYGADYVRVGTAIFGERA